MDNPSGDVVGKRVPRIDGWSKVTGRATYTADLRPRNALVAGFLVSPHPHARIQSIDTASASGLPGVKAILTSENTPDRPFNRANKWPKDVEFLPQDERLFPRTVRHVGDRVAAVAAVDEDTLREALKRIKVDYALLPAAFDPATSLSAEALRIHPNGNLAHRFVESSGDIEAALEMADHVFEERFTTQAAAQVPVEPHTCFAAVDDAGRLGIWTATQLPFTVQRGVAQILDLGVGEIRLVKPELGGGFGAKDEIGIEPIVAMLALRTGRAVYMEYSREEEFYHSHRHPSEILLKTGVNKDGRLVARQAITTLNTGAYASMGPKVLRAGLNHWAALYPVEHMQYEGSLAYTNIPPSGAFRGYGNPQITFAMECHMDTIAHELGIDPVDLRKRNHIRSGEIYPMGGWTIQSCGLSECLDKGAERMDFRSKHGHSSSQDGPLRRGVGVAAAIHVSGAQPSAPELSSASVRLNEDGTVTVSSGTPDLGTGAKTIQAQLVASTLGIPMKSVHIVPLDTDTVPYDPGAFGSRTTFVGGMAVKLAAEDLRRQLLEQIGDRLGVRPEQLVCADGKIFVREHPERGMSLAEAAFSIQFDQTPHVLVGRADYAPQHNAPPFVAHFAEVTVDVETGVITVEKLVLAQDSGVVINPLQLEGQMEGGAYQGLGYSIMEELAIDPESGSLTNPSLMDYRMFTPADMPEIETLFVETVDPGGPFGAKGAGEIVLVAVAPAVANAVYDALGVRIRDLPLTSDRVLTALQHQETD